MHVCVPCESWCSSLDSLGNRIRDVCELSCGYLEPNLHPWESNKCSQPLNHLSFSSVLLLSMFTPKTYLHLGNFQCSAIINYTVAQLVSNFNKLAELYFKPEKITVLKSCVNSCPNKPHVQLCSLLQAWSPQEVLIFASVHTDDALIIESCGPWLFHTILLFCLVMSSNSIPCDISIHKIPYLPSSHIFKISR